MQRKAKQTLNFTKAAIEKLVPPEAGRLYHYDDKTPGLAVCVMASGTKTFYVVRRVERKVEFIRIGGWPEWTVENARNEAARINGKVASGINPAEQRRVELAQKQTLRNVFDEFIELPTRTKNNIRPKSEKTKYDYRQQFNLYLADWHDRKLTAIRKVDVEELRNDLAKNRGHYTANRVVVLLKVLFNLAMERGWCRKDNPAVGVALFAEESRERFVQPSELPKFFAALEAEKSEKVRDAIKMLLWTGQRRMNVLSMRWADVSIADAKWQIPKTKSGKSHTVPLPSPALEILTRRFAAKGAGEYVFPGHHGGGHLRDIMRQWRSILAAAELKDFRPHDLRRSLGSWAAADGASSLIIGKMLAHADPRATQIYTRLNVDPVRNAMETATASIIAAATPKRKKKDKAKCSSTSRVP